MTLDEFKMDMKWWESKRWIFNLSVGLFGIYASYDGVTSNMEYSWTRADTMGIIWWGIGANILYSLGILAELFDWYYLKNKLHIKRFRLFFFISGLLFSCFWTLWCTWLYFAKPHLW
ncbi:hypothetical protein GTQ34_16165 [Muricauda sp. JGD-17]|uniref:Uncharacterized protein n=1 Tax=Flagellimonas ochracea TaxID=2696472 RepID=A0A964TEG2_9FLAO|nr:hypothetical protein [Allomuricauda ochracea]NAY93447.1 hypothetical protein [Allomuricauda ochracea]